MKRKILLALILTLVITGCSTWRKLNGTEKGVVIGGGSGAVLGSSVAGSGGALLGGLGGAAIGGLVGHETDGKRKR